MDTYALRCLGKLNLSAYSQIDPERCAELSGCIKTFWTISEVLENSLSAERHFFKGFAGCLRDPNGL